jgi:hypothetical protein
MLDRPVPAPVVVVDDGVDDLVVFEGVEALDDLRRLRHLSG